ncbi:MAG TPA: DUF1801 domain-containing protein [Thermoanaerobaculia bacterium]|nr:DUF1801 domain-containing protein [Thermoanaerobaculia bacterium]
MSEAAETQLARFLARYSPEVAAVARDARAALAARMPHAVQLVYDNYNALVIVFGPSEKASQAVFSLALYPRYVTFFFANGASLDDPAQVLKGAGRVVRHVVLRSAEDFERPEIRALMKQALDGVTFDESVDARLVIKSISAKQRPRKPSR